jgi:hypothetical protein
MSIAYTKANSDQPVAVIFAGPEPKPGDTIWSTEEGRNITCSRIRVNVALSEMSSFGPIFSEPGGHNYPDSFDDVRAMCRWAIRSGGKVIISTIK